MSTKNVLHNLHGLPEVYLYFKKYLQIEECFFYLFATAMELYRLQTVKDSFS